jgi:FkbM family methyltransferase
MFARLDVLKKKFGFDPKVIYDIGAHEGVWTKDCKSIFPSATYYQFEANTDQRGKLHDNPRFEVLGNTDDQVVEYFKSKSAFTTGNSILKENTDFFRGDEFYTEARKMKRLDTIILTDSLPSPDFLKLDTQGSELLILEGASKCMDHVQIIMLEVSLHCYNEKSPLIYDVLHFMKEHGFVMFDIADLHYISNVLGQVDLLFCKPESPYLVKSF